MDSETKLSRFILGTAGHIDHGKSKLVRRLTGIDPDRLAEEKRRGMTIDIGFASLVLPNGRKVGFIDVPGHEKFVKNMVAGAASVHGALLIVAADDSVMPQTVEHLAILDFLGVQDGFVVVTKTDLVDEETVEIVKLDVREAVKGTFLEGKPIVPVSSLTLEGFDELKRELTALCDRIEDRAPTGFFRLPVHRAFTSKGLGTVVTGVAVSGTLRVGDEVELVPGGLRGKVRGLQSYKQDVDEVFPGPCVAVNVSDVRKDEVERGMVLAEPGYLVPKTEVEVLLRFAPVGDNRPLKDYALVNFHAGSAEAPGHVALIGGRKAVAPGETVFAQMRLLKPVVTWPGMRFILRRPTPPLTLGGGVVLSATGVRLRRKAPETLLHFERRLAALDDPAKLAACVIAEGGRRTVHLREICSETGLKEEELAPIVEKLVSGGEAIRLPDGAFTTAAALEDMEKAILDRMEELHRTNPLRLYHGKAAIRAAVEGDEQLFEAALQALAGKGLLEQSKGAWKLADYRPPLDDESRRLADRLLAWFRSSPWDAHSPNAAAADWKVEPEKLRRVYSLLVESGEVVSLPDGVYLSAAAVEEAESKLRAYLEEHGSIRSGDFKKVLGSSRKVAIAALDHFEKNGVTYRKGNEHFLRRY